MCDCCSRAGSREIPCPADEGAGLRDDLGGWVPGSQFKQRLNDALPNVRSACFPILSRDAGHFLRRSRRRSWESVPAAADATCAVVDLDGISAGGKAFQRIGVFDGRISRRAWDGRYSPTGGKIARSALGRHVCRFPIRRGSDVTVGFGPAHRRVGFPLRAIAVYIISPLLVRFQVELP